MYYIVHQHPLPFLQWEWTLPLKEREWICHKKCNLSAPVGALLIPPAEQSCFVGRIGSALTSRKVAFIWAKHYFVPNIIGAEGIFIACSLLTMSIFEFQSKFLQLWNIIFLIDNFSGQIKISRPNCKCCRGWGWGRATAIPVLQNWHFCSVPIGYQPHGWERVTSVQSRHSKKYMDYLGIFPNIGGWGFPNSQTLIFPKRALKSP